MNELKKSEIERLKILSKKIEDLQFTRADLEEYESILRKAGFTEEKVKSVMIENGFNTYDDYVLAVANAKSVEQKRIVSAIVKPFLIALGLVVFTWVIRGIIKTVRG